MISVDGSWTEWTEWRECSRSCGGGFHSRSRTCTNPRPKHGGENCSGRPDETRPCNTQTCPGEKSYQNQEKKYRKIVGVRSVFLVKIVTDFGFSHTFGVFFFFL